MEAQGQQRCTAGTGTRRFDSNASTYFLAHLRIPVGGATHAQGGGFAVEAVTVAGGGNGVQASAMGNFLALAIHLGTLQNELVHCDNKGVYQRQVISLCG